MWLSAGETLDDVRQQQFGFAESWHDAGRPSPHTRRAQADVDFACEPNLASPAIGFDLPSQKVVLHRNRTVYRRFGSDAVSVDAFRRLSAAAFAFERRGGIDATPACSKLGIETACAERGAFAKLFSREIGYGAPAPIAWFLPGCTDPAKGSADVTHFAACPKHQAKIKESFANWIRALPQ